MHLVPLANLYAFPPQAPAHWESSLSLSLSLMKAPSLHVIMTSLFCCVLAYEVLADKPPHPTPCNVTVLAILAPQLFASLDGVWNTALWGPVVLLCTPRSL